MGNVAISVEDLGKRYRIGHAAKRPENLREALRSFLGTPFHYLNTRFREPAPDELFWAVKDVSFEVQHGEVLGIIGRNGAGKSTLLKILSRITEPTTGLAQVYGRVGSLLEVGTGFHPELTGRENIYLNGAILGMRRTEITRHFDEIVDFSGVERFLDMPVKRYSSGMYVRLAFAVAAHLEPDILLVDEVLAVGDLDFQKKCLGKLENVSKQGRTVLMVSHNLQSIRALCSQCALFHNGGMVLKGATEKTIQAYYELFQKPDIHDMERYGSGVARFTDIAVENHSGKESFNFLIGDVVRFVLSYKVFSSVDRLAVNVGLRSGISRESLGSTAKYWISQTALAPGQTGSVVIEFPTDRFRPGEYPIWFGLSDPTRLLTYDFVDDVTLPLSLYTDKEPEEFGFTTAVTTGFYTFHATMRSMH